MSRHAYCIIAHNDPYCLQSLINTIDDERNDIFLILDKKSDIKDFAGIKTRKSRLITPPKSNTLIFNGVACHKSKQNYFHSRRLSDMGNMITFICCPGKTCH